MMAPIFNELSILKDYLGSVYWPFFGINTIGDIKQGEGYQIKTNYSETLTLTGNLTPYDYEINLPIPNRWHTLRFSLRTK